MNITDMCEVQYIFSDSSKISDCPDADKARHKASFRRGAHCLNKHKAQGLLSFKQVYSTMNHTKSEMLQALHQEVLQKENHQQNNHR